MSAAHPRSPRQRPAGLRHGLPAAAALLLFTAALSLLWSSVRLMWNDEFLSWYGDSTPTLRDVWNVQLHAPISLDPPAYHLLSHLAMDVLGRSAIALRLPALAGFLLLQSCLFLLVRSIAGMRPALLAMLLPVCTASFRYSVEGRPYGLLLGLYAAALLSWYTAARARDSEPLTRRVLPLTGLALSIALALLSHYFGVLVMIPLVLGELARTLERRRLDPPMLAALAAGCAAIALVLPFQHALTPYRQHYYITAVSLHAVSQGYRELFLRYTTWPIPAQRITALLMAIATAALFALSLRRARRRPGGEAAYLWWALLALALLPVFGFLFGRFVTHTMEVRYVIAALIPFAVTLAVLLAPLLRNTRVFATLLAGLLLFAAAVNLLQVRTEQQHSHELLAALAIPPTLHEALAANPSALLYTQSLENFFRLHHDSPDPLVRDRIRLLYDFNREVRWLGHDTNAVTAVYLPRFSRLRTVAYRDFLAQPDALLLNYGSGWEWVPRDLQAEHVPLRAEGRAVGADLLVVHPSASATAPEVGAAGAVLPSSPR